MSESKWWWKQGESPPSTHLHPANRPVGPKVPTANENPSKHHTSSFKSGSHIMLPKLGPPHSTGCFQGKAWHKWENNLNSLLNPKSKRSIYQNVSSSLEAFWGLWRGKFNEFSIVDCSYSGCDASNNQERPHKDTWLVSVSPYHRPFPSLNIRFHLRWQRWRLLL